MIVNTFKRMVCMGLSEIVYSCTRMYFDIFRPILFLIFFLTKINFSPLCVFSASYTGSSSDEDDVNPREKEQVSIVLTPLPQ